MLLNGSLLRSLAIASAVLFALTVPSWADVTYTNLGAGGTFNTTGCLNVEAAQWLGASFTATVSGSLSTIRVPLLAVASPSQPLIITLRAPGAIPTGTVLEQWTVTAAQLSTTPALIVLTSVANPVLTAGQTYWIRMQSAQVNSDPYYGWCLNNTGVQGVATSFDSGATWNTAGTYALIARPAMEVNVTALAPILTFDVRYFSNLAFGESVINLTNSGANSTPQAITAPAQNGEICANIYAYSPDEQLVSCCSCNVTPNALNSLSVKADLGANTLTPIIPSALVVKILTTPGGTACTAASAATVTSAALVPGLLAWGTTIHALPAAGGAPVGAYGVTETPFAKALLSEAELARMTGLCAFIRANGSGYGICKSCKVGGLGASVK